MIGMYFIAGLVCNLLHGWYCYNINFLLSDCNVFYRFSKVQNYFNKGNVGYILG
jgi:hypothetical protein